MVYLDSPMARCDPSSEKENLVPRAHRSESGSGGLGSVRTRGLMSNEQRLHTVLKESSLQNQTPATVVSSKTSLGSTEKERLKNGLLDYPTGKQAERSLERLKEKIGQLKSGGALKSLPHKTASAFDYHAVGEIHSRGLSPNVSEAVVHVYRDDMVSKSGGVRKDSPHPKNVSHSDFVDSSKRSVQSKVDSGEPFINENHSTSSSPIEATSGVVSDTRENHSVAGETLRITPPREGGVKNSVDPFKHDKVVSALKRAKVSAWSHGPALRVLRDDPRAYPHADFSSDSEKSSDDVQTSPEALHASKMADSHANVHTMPKISEVGTFSASKSNQRVVHQHTDQDIISEHRKRKAEVDPSTTDTSLLTGLGNDRQVSLAVAVETHAREGNVVQREREGHRRSMERETRPEPTALEQNDERTEDGHPLLGSCTKVTPGHDREPWAWKAARDARALTHPSPTSHEHSKSGKCIGGIPPRYVPPMSEARERVAEENESPPSNGFNHHCGVMKQINEYERSELHNGVISHSNSHMKGLACTDDNAVCHLSNTFSTISIEEKVAPGPNGTEKMPTQQGRTVSGHRLNFVPAEGGSHTGVTGVTGLTSPSAVKPLKTTATPSHGVELQHKVYSQQPSREGDRGVDMPAPPKSAIRPTLTAAEVPLQNANEGQSAKASDLSKDRGEKDQKLSQPNPQPPRKMRTETENDKFVIVNGTRYQKLGKIGKGGSSEVFKVIATDCSIYALKRINLKGRDWSTAQEFYQEIKYLRALRGKRHIIQLIDSEVTNKKVLEKRSESGDITEESCIYMVLEFGEIDLAGMLSAKRKQMQSENKTEPDENWLRFYWQQILEAVRTIHDERIVHSDLKPANFMLVRGELKLIDFGIAKAIQNDTTNIVKENQTGTLNYMSPEAFLQGQTDRDGSEIKIGRASDIWSLGCIFYQMVYGQTPFAELSIYSKMQAITNQLHKIHYPRVSNPWLPDMIKKCLTWDRRKRLRIPELLEHPFLRPLIAPYCSRCEHLVTLDQALPMASSYCPRCSEHQQHRHPINKLPAE